MFLKAHHQGAKNAKNPKNHDPFTNNPRQEGLLEGNLYPKESSRPAHGAQAANQTYEPIRSSEAPYPRVLIKTRSNTVPSIVSELRSASLKNGFLLVVNT